ncbi:tonb-dependent receptor beta-barrel [Desulfoluna butyratoxydans]|uniref:Tonb-dependent receptor beta-barrel n=2 Tax=Desulfoluna butyratoxydans TaxID=231438 RepID=A0A4U8YTA6_9BACT|nr:tonb-dependent receptor beta-barrel [Desulfoluna butyratoxydans]
MKRSLMIGAVAAWVAASSPAWATDAALDEYVVTASRAKESITEVAAAVTVIDSEAIENSSARNLGELLVEKGGVQIREYPGALTTVKIRGFSTDTHGNDLMGNVLILIDGRRAGTGNAAKLITKNVERVEIIKGPAAVQYGSAAMGGVVNVITKKGNGKPAVSAYAKTGSYDYNEFETDVSGKTGKIDFSASVSHSEEGDYETGSGKEYLNTGNDGILRASLNTGYEFSPGHRIGLTYTLFDGDNIGNPGSIEANDLDNTKDSENSSYDITYDGKNGTSSLAWMLRYFGGTDKDTWNDPVDSNASGWDDGIPSEHETDSKGAQAQVSYDGQRFGLTTGVDWVDYDVTNEPSAPNKTAFDNTAGFALGKVKFLDQKLIFLGGARYDHYSVDISGDQGNDKSDDDLNPSLGVVYNLTKQIKLRASFADAFRMPSAEQLAADFTSYGTHYVGNPDLNPEKSRTYEAGVDVTHGRLKTGLTVFTTEYDDKIVTDQQHGFTTYKNLDEATISGVEGEFSYTFSDLFGGWELRPYATLTHLFKYEDAETDKDLKYTSDLDISAGIALTDLDGFSSDLSVSYLSSQDVVKYNPDWSTSDVTLPSVTVTNFTITKRVLTTDKLGSLSLRGEVKNLFDEDAAYVLGYPIPGRRFFAGVTWSY